MVSSSSGGAAVVINADPNALVREDVRAIKRDADAFGVSRLAFRDLAFSIVSRDGSATRSILEPTSGTFECGEMAAIMGPSGSGKTTLLDMIAGKKTARYAGEVFLNGVARDGLFARLTAYVPQQDVLPAHVTVEEAIRFVVDLRASSHLSPAEREKAVADVLALLGLQGIRDELVGDERVRGISGGQKRRVTLARGLAGGSQIVFADEPTSGLSATDAETVTRAMAVAAKRMGVIFVAVIHAPRREVFELFDSLILLTSNPGRAVYNGPRSQADAYFAAGGSPVPTTGCNAADFFLDVITPGAFGERSAHFAALYETTQAALVESRVEASLAATSTSSIALLKSTAAARGEDPTQVHASPIAASFMTQLRVLMKRKLVLTGRNKAGLRLRLGVAVMQGIVVGAAFYDIGKKRPVQQLSFFFMLLQMGAIANIAILPELIETRLILKLEESDALYSSGASIIVQSSVNNVLAILGNLTTTTLMFAMSGIGWSYFHLVLGWSVLNFFTVTNYLRVIAAIAPTPAQSVQTAMPGLLAFILFNNFFISRATAPVFIKFMIYVSPLAWTIEQLITGIYGANDDVISLYGYDGSTGRTLTALGVLLAECALFQALEVIALRKVKYISR